MIVESAVTEGFASDELNLGMLAFFSHSWIVLLSDLLVPCRCCVEKEKFSQRVDIAETVVLLIPPRPI